MTAPFVYGNGGREREGGPRNNEKAEARNASDTVRPEGERNVSASGTRVDRKAPTDVGAVVSKAKKAAASLCTILHAQRCKESPYRCPVKGCAEAKIVLLHIKTCGARAGEACPKNFQGCCQTRKLLAHYDQCREVRARQARQKSTSRSSGRQQQQHVCLVCSLMARHARNILEGGKAPSHTSGKTRRIISSFTLSKQKNSSETTAVVIPAQLIRSPSAKSMPPPPSRRPQDTSPDQEESIFSSSLPSSSELMSKEITTVAAATAPQPTGEGPVHPSMLGKSLDTTSTYMDKMSALLNATRDDIARVNAGFDKHSRPAAGHPTRRSRSESYDERSGSKARQQRSVLVPHDFVGEQNDPTVEVMLTKGNDHASTEEYGGTHSRRRRSASLGVLVEGASRCATILEEESDTKVNDAENEEAFPMDD